MKTTRLVFNLFTDSTAWTDDPERLSPVELFSCDYMTVRRKSTAEKFLHHARMEWSVESMHWLLDVHFEEDWCRVEDKAVQQHLNMFRKAAINLIKLFKERTKTKRAISNIMLDCLIDSNCILRVVGEN